MSARTTLAAHRVLASAVGVGVVAVVFVAVLATRSTQPGTIVSSALIGRPAPAISGVDIRTGRTVSLSALRGRFVVVDFFASWCTPCQSEIAPLEALLFAHRHADDVAILGVVFSDSASNAKSFLARSGASWPAVMDPSGKVAVAYGVADPPQSFVVGPNGRVLERIVGSVTTASLDAAVPS